jgi:hypothetical protein
VKTLVKFLAIGASAGALLLPAGVARAQLLITGNDEKMWFDETGKIVNQPPGKDTVSIIDISDPTKPRIVAPAPHPRPPFTGKRNPTWPSSGSTERRCARWRRPMWAALPKASCSARMGPTSMSQISSTATSTSCDSRATR